MTGLSYVCHVSRVVLFVPFLSGDSGRGASTVVGNQVFPAFKFTQGE